MAESVHKSSDIPNFDTYPSAPPAGMAGRSGAQRSSLEERAVELGAAAGRLALLMRQTKDSLENLAQHRIYDRVTVLAENARIRTENLRRTAGIRAKELTQKAQEKAAELGYQARERSAELGRQARSNYRRARLKVNQTVRDYPVETALAVGALGFLAGVGLRIRRAKRAY
jgi:ElaB/YqjD/DUF883 family membrane-anchored ribosome-binding protein